MIFPVESFHFGTCRPKTNFSGFEKWEAKRKKKRASPHFVTFPPSIFNFPPSLLHFSLASFFFSGRSAEIFRSEVSGGGHSVPLPCLLCHCWSSLFFLSCTEPRPNTGSVFYFFFYQSELQQRINTQINNNHTHSYKTMHFSSNENTEKTWSSLIQRSLFFYYYFIYFFNYVFQIKTLQGIYLGRLGRENSYLGSIFVCIWCFLKCFIPPFHRVSTIKCQSHKHWIKIKHKNTHSP